MFRSLDSGKASYDEYHVILTCFTPDDLRSRLHCRSHPMGRAAGLIYLTVDVRRFGWAGFHFDRTRRANELSSLPGKCKDFRETCINMATPAGMPEEKWCRYRPRHLGLGCRACGCSADHAIRTLRARIRFPVGHDQEQASMVRA